MLLDGWESLCNVFTMCINLSDEHVYKYGLKFLLTFYTKKQYSLSIHVRTKACNYKLIYANQHN